MGAFLAALREFNSPEWGWTVTRVGLIRNINEDCPIEFLAQKRDAESFQSAGKRLGLYPYQVTTIMKTADKMVWHKSYSPQLRKELLDALNLTETERTKTA